MSTFVCESKCFLHQKKHFKEEKYLNFCFYSLYIFWQHFEKLTCYLHILHINAHKLKNHIECSNSDKAG